MDLEKQYIVINQDRSVVVPESLKKLGVKGDHKVNTVSFRCPRFWNGWDLTGLTVYINYQRSDSEKGSAIAEKVTVDTEDENIVIIDWLVKSHVTKVVGNVVISVCAKSTDEEGNENVHWNSESDKTTYISDGLECYSEIVEQYPDVITQLLDRMETVENAASELIVINSELQSRLDGEV